MEITSFIFENYIVSFLIAALVFYYSISHLRKSHKNYPPGPKGVWLLGYLPFLGPHPHKVLGDLGDKYGDIIMFRAGFRNIVVLNSVEAIKEGFVKQGDNFAAAFPGFRILDYGMAHLGVFCEGGNSWKLQRNFIMSTMRDFGVGKLSMEDRVLEECDAMIEEISKLNGKPFVVTPLMEKVVINIVSSILFGTRQNHDDPKLDDYAKCCEAFDIAFSEHTIFDFLPFVNKLPGWLTGMATHDRKRDDLLKHLKPKISNIIKNYDESNLNCLVECYIYEMNKRNASGDRKHPFDYGRLQSNVIAIIIAGTITTSMTLTWAIVLLIIYPEVTQRILRELDAVVGSERRPSWSDRIHLPYVDATIHEVQRYADVVPIGVPHASQDDCVVMNYDIPKNSIVYGNFRKLHTDRKLWKDPDNFRPDRFIDEKTGHCVKPEYLMPFGAGKRSCPGDILARMNMFYVLTSILQNFNIEAQLNDADINDIKNQTVGIIRYLKPIDISLKRKHSPLVTTKMNAHK